MLLAMLMLKQPKGCYNVVHVLTIYLRLRNHILWKEDHGPHADAKSEWQLHSGESDGLESSSPPANTNVHVT